MRFQYSYNPKLLLSILIPLLACSLQWLLWPILYPKTWILLYPAVFFSAALGGLVGGTMATCLAALLGVYLFIEPAFAWVIGDTNSYLSLIIFLLMGLMFSLVFDRYHRAMAELRRLTNLELEVQQNRLMLALDAANAGIWEWNMVTNQNVWTDSLWRLLGLEPDSCQPSYDVWLSTIHSDDRSTVEENIKYALENRSELNIAWRSIQVVDGKERWLMSRGQPSLNSKGEVQIFRGIVIDISERKAIEKQLKDNEQLLNHVLETLKVGAWELDLTTHTAYRTLQHDQIFGYSTLLPEWSYDIFLNHVLAEDRPTVDSCFREATANLSNWDFECRICRADGSIRCILATGSHRFNESGLPVSMVGIVQDITERKKIETESNYLNMRYRALADQAAPDGMFVHNHNGDFLEVNRQACQSVGYSKKELLTMNVLDLEQDFDLARAQAEWSRIMPGENNILYGHHRRKDGHQFPVEIHFGLLMFEGQRLYIALVRDITVRKQIEQTLKEKERFLADSQTIAHIGSWMMDIKTGQITWSEESFRLYGLSPKTDAAPGWEQFLELLHPDDRFSMQNWYEDCIAGKQSSGLQFRTHKKNGSYRWLLCSGQLETGSKGEPLRMIGTVQDITQQKQAEATMQESAARTQAILDTVADGIITIDKRGIIETFNPAAERIFGYDADEVIGRNLNMLMPESYSNRHDSCLEHYLAGGQANIIDIGGIVEGRRKNGYTFPLDLAVSETQLGEECIFTGIVRDITEREIANDKLKAALNEKEVLLKEVYHRVKNNLQVVSSLINLQARNVKNEEALKLLKQSADRIKAMALLHEKLYQSKDLAKIDFNEYIGSLIDSLLYGFGPQASQIKINTNIKDVFLEIDTAIPCGLIINELLSNAIMHAFPQGQQGKIDISFTCAQNEFKLVITDNGIGLPKGLDIKKCTSLGLQLVTRLTTDQLKGYMILEQNMGSSFIIHFSNVS